MRNKKLGKNDIVLIKDALIVKYEGVKDKKPRPYIILFESKNYCIAYQVTSKRSWRNKSERILFKHQALSYKPKSYVKLKHPYVIPKVIKNQKIAQISISEHRYLLANINSSDLFSLELKKAFTKNQKFEKNMQKLLQKIEINDQEIEL